MKVLLNTGFSDKYFKFDIDEINLRDIIKKCKFDHGYRYVSNTSCLYYNKYIFMTIYKNIESMKIETVYIIMRND